ncbi:BspA family leucine-rich repeat surface protein [Flagellimonas baculiformis]|uniref:BspA family leucine-rich repeat surface protein n=1 Tax=Flagellimonas baculiformis TaxID=3067310 RepID=UPI00296F8AE8|nr:BspA family leucine-rich repeat surface protein [Muricauda sp. D6]
MKNITKKLGTALLAIALLWSCGKDDGPEPANNAPVIADQAFNVSEDITPADAIGTVTATDADGDKLSFAIKANDGDLFAITSAGALTLAEGKSLDFATTAQHTITVEASDGDKAATAKVTVNVSPTGTDPNNTAPEIADQEFSAKEDIADTAVIGTVEASDADGDEISFAITADADGLFEVDAATGELSLMEGKALDFEAKAEHSITVEARDGDKSATATVAIKVTNVIEGLAEDPTSFVTTWKTEADNEEIYIITNVNYTYDYTIDWGDGTVEQLTGDASHAYASAGTHTVAIKGQFPAVFFSSDFVPSADPTMLQSIEQWGSIQWERMYGTFAKCSNMVLNATDTPDLSQVTDMSYMFRNAASFNGDLSGWDTSNVTYMGSMFAGANSFNGDISGWDTSKVIDMSYMFSGATAFNRDLSGWDTSNVAYMSAIFYGATAFDQNLGNWDISSVIHMYNMLDNSGMSALNFSNTLIGWSNLEVQPNVELNAEGVNICENGGGFAAYAALSGAPNNWTITFGSSEVCD